ncbi:MAG: STAS domain-containing protein [Nitrospirae bacterium]|nr:STAS domain-containing protein [Nitrospirota bacterium]MBF0541221.1 STAS domain-containing protein [Nitrospirota bacterium]
MPIIKNISDDGKLVTIKVQGIFNIGLYQDFSAAYKDNLLPGTKYILDLEETDGIDSSALGMLLLLRERAGGDNANISIINVNQSLSKIFQVSNFHRLFSIKTK